MSGKSDDSGQVHPAKRHIDEALRIVSGARREKYGPPAKNFQRIAWLWQAYLSSVEDAAGGPINLRVIDVCHMLDLVKLARLIESPDHEDSITDRFGYQACYVDLIAGERKAEQPPKPSANSTWVDPDDAPEWTQEQWERADLYHGDKLVPRGQPNEEPASAGWVEEPWRGGSFGWLGACG